MELQKPDQPQSWFGRFAHHWLRHADEAKDDAAKVEAETLGSRVDDALGLIRGILEKWPIPRVRDNRAFQWRSDEEFGRAVRTDTESSQYNKCMDSSNQACLALSAEYFLL